jgi:hypothetical protein
VTDWENVTTEQIDENYLYYVEALEDWHNQPKPPWSIAQREAYAAAREKKDAAFKAMVESLPEAATTRSPTKLPHPRRATYEYRAARMWIWEENRWYPVLERRIINANDGSVHQDWDGGYIHDHAVAEAARRNAHNHKKSDT